RQNSGFRSESRDRSSIPSRQKCEATRALDTFHVPANDSSQMGSRTECCSAAQAGRIVPSLVLGLLPRPLDRSRWFDGDDFARDWIHHRDYTARRSNGVLQYAAHSLISAGVNSQDVSCWGLLKLYWDK